MDPFAEFIHPDAPWDDALAQLLGDGTGWPSSAGDAWFGEPGLDLAAGGAGGDGNGEGEAAFAGFQDRFGTGYGYEDSLMAAVTSPSAGSVGTHAGTTTSISATETTYTSSPPGEHVHVRVKGEGSTEGDVGWGVVGQGWGVAPALLGIPEPGLGADKMPTMQYGTHVPVAPVASMPLPLPLPLPPPPPAAPAPAAKLHNKVEKRYRYNVKNALETLRDSVPRLRQVYGTSLPLELATTDREDGRGLMGGLEPLGKPTKKTVMLGARLYIEYLETEQRVQAVRLGRAEDALRARLGGEEWSVWKIETEHQAMRVREEYAALLEDKAKIRAGQAGDEAEREEDVEEEDEVARPKKRTRAEAVAEKKPRQTTGPRKARTSVASASSQSSGTTTATTAFYSFGLAYVLFPRATEWLRYRPRDASTATATTTTNGGTGTSGKVLLPMDNVVAATNGWISPTVLDMMGYLVMGVVIMACVYLFSRGRDVQENEDEEPVEADGNERLGQRLARNVGLGTVSGLVKEIVYRVPFLREESTCSSTNAAWYKLHSAQVGGGTKFGRLESLHLRLHLARHADDAALAMLHALQSNESARHEAWIKARKIANGQDSARSLQDVSVLPLHEAEQWLHKVTPTRRPLEDIANHLVLEELDHVLTHLYVTLVAATYPTDASGTQLAVLVDHMQRSTKATHAVLADSAFKARIQRVLAGVEKESESHILGLVVIGLWGHLVGQEASRQRALANMLIAQQIQRPDGLIADLASVDLLLALIVPGYKNPKSIKKRTHRHLSATAQELDNVASVCLRYLLLLRSVPQLAKSDAPRQQRLRSSIYVRQACLEIRMLLARPAFDTRAETDLGVLVSAGDTRASSPIDTADRSNDDEAEDADFARQTDRLIDLMTIVGCRAASRAGGRDDDSGVEGDLEEL